MRLEAAFAIASLAFGAFVILRAINVPLTYDEAAAYLRYISVYPFAVVDFSVATNHLLNTLLVKLAAAAAGNGELVLRSPALVGYGLYLCFSALILRDLNHRVLAGAWFLILNLNPYVLEYFALSRGYGLSVGLMMAALCFLFRYLRDLEAGNRGPRNLSYALLFASAAALANFAMLNVYLALLGVVSVTAMMFVPRTERLQRSQVPRLTGTGTLVFLLATTVSTAIIFSQDVNLSPRLYEPVTVGLATTDDSPPEHVSVFRIDHRGRREPLQRHGALWELDRRAAFAGIRIELPRTLADTLRSIEVSVGDRVFAYERAIQILWSTTDTGDVRAFESNPSLSLPRSSVPAFRPMLNWSGDRQYAAQVAIHTALAIGMVGVVALLLAVTGWLLARSNLIAGDVWRTLSASALWTGALVGPPLYLLRRNGELYYGGVSGLIEDTFYSCIHGSFYGKTYHADQTAIAFVCIVSAVVILGAILAISRRKVPTTRLPGLSLLAIMVIVAIGVVAQRLLFDTPYLLGRTAIFFIPLSMMFLALGSDVLGELNRTGRLAAGAFAAVILSLSLYHFLGTANLKSSFDWPQDASTRLMIADLAEITATERQQGARVTLGVDWVYYPVTVYYARRAAPEIDVEVLPGSATSEFVYVENIRRAPAGQVLRRYARTGSALVRIGR